MSNKDVKKNFALSAAFNSYVVKNPAILKNVPKKACIVFTVKSDPTFSRNNVALAERMMRDKKTACYKAEKSAGGWRLMRLRLSM